ncbi:MAG: hypothetical protein OXU71_11240 [Gammaproteobacteria bacterium]|nr:hypothetical protein [Gammaproteobacteria bacterium]
MKTRHRNRAFCASFAVVAVAVIAFAAAAALPQAAQAQSQSSAVAVLQSEMTDVKAAIIRIDKRFERIDEQFKRVDQRFNSVEQSIVRLDEKVNGLQMQNQFVIIPLLLLLVATMFGLLTKGTYWGRERAPNPSAGAAHRGGGAQPVATPA